MAKLSFLESGFIQLSFLTFSAAPALAATYVVDQMAPGASDLNAGTEGVAFKTIQHAANLAQPGDMIFVMPGAYREKVIVRNSGNEEHPIAFRGMPGRSARVESFDIRASYVEVQGFEITANPPGTAVQLGGSHCVVSDNFIHDMMVGVAGTVGTIEEGSSTRNYSAVAHNRIVYNKVQHSEYGFLLGGNDWVVENNEVERLYMYAQGKRYDDCDYSRFFGKGCIERFNYYHGSIGSEIRVAHVDCLQTFTVNGEIAQDLLFEDNTCFDFHQLCMVESAPHLGSVRNWTLRRNIVSADSPALRGAWGPDIIQTPNVTIDHNTICGVRWATIGLRGAESTNGRILNNILCNSERAVIDGDKDFSASSPAIEFNLIYQAQTPAGKNNLSELSPKFEDAAHRNFRLQTGSPAIGAGQDGATIGALEFPNVYFVDPRHPAATDDPGWGYPAVPLASLARACQLAKPGDSIVLRGGVYRETLKPQCDGITIRCLPGEKAVISRADVVDGWERLPDGSWSTSLGTAPKKLLRDGQPWAKFKYNRTQRRLVVRENDPRLHRYEVITRRRAVELGSHRNVKIEGVEQRDFL